MIFKRLELGIFARLLLLFGLMYVAVYYLLHPSYVPVVFAASTRSTRPSAT